MAAVSSFLWLSDEYKPFSSLSAELRTQLITGTFVSSRLSVRCNGYITSSSSHRLMCLLSSPGPQAKLFHHEASSLIYVPLWKWERERGRVAAAAVFFQFCYCFAKLYLQRWWWKKRKLDVFFCSKNEIGMTEKGSHCFGVFASGFRKHDDEMLFAHFPQTIFWAVLVIIDKITIEYTLAHS